ncbi:MAG: hypothetical protein IEMM0002_0761 [bacterium]|nr:MAG: hypothetical protein IEMM0002_0761 [bacterium]
MNIEKIFGEIAGNLCGVEDTAKAHGALQTALASIVEVEGMDAGWLRILDEKGDIKIFAEAGRSLPSFCFDGMSPPDCLCKRAFLEADGVCGYDSKHAFCSKNGFKTAACIPALQNGIPVGFLFMASSEQKPVNLAGLRAVAGQLAITARRLIRNAEMEKRLKTLRTVTRVGAIVSSQLTLRELTQSVVEHLGEVLRTDRVNLVLYHAGKQELEFIATFISGEEKTDKPEKYPLSDGMNSWIVKNRRPLLIREDTVKECSKRGIRHGGRPAKSWLGVPVVHNGKIAGVLSVQSYNEPNLYDKSSVEMLNLVAGQIAVAVENAQLYESMAKREKEKQQLYYSLTHDILSFVTPVAGFGEVIKRMAPEELAARKDEIGEAVLNSANRITRFVEDILLFAKVQSGKLELNTGAVNIYRIIDQSVSNFFSELNMRKLDIYIEGEKVKEAAAHFPQKIVTCDMLQIERVLNNCLQNAVKHASSKVEVTTQTGPDELFCTVSDDGEGMPREFVQNVFDEYYQMEHGKKGVGLGLPSVKRIVEKHGGSVNVETDMGLGFSFTFSLPVTHGVQKRA